MPHLDTFRVSRNLDSAGRQPWGPWASRIGLVVLIGATSLALGVMVSWWMMLVYLLLMTLLLSGGSWAPNRVSEPLPAESVAEGLLPLVETSATGNPGPDDQGTEATTGKDEGEPSARPRRRRKPRSKGKEPAVEPAPANVSWIQVAPGKFVRVETPIEAPGGTSESTGQAGPSLESDPIGNPVSPAESSLNPNEDAAIADSSGASPNEPALNPDDNVGNPIPDDLPDSEFPSDGPSTADATEPISGLMTTVSTEGRFTPRPEWPPSARSGPEPGLLREQPARHEHGSHPSIGDRQDAWGDTPEPQERSPPRQCSISPRSFRQRSWVHATSIRARRRGRFIRSMARNRRPGGRSAIRPHGTRRPCRSARGLRRS